MIRWEYGVPEWGKDHAGWGVIIRPNIETKVSESEVKELWTL